MSINNKYLDIEPIREAVRKAEEGYRVQVDPKSQILLEVANIIKSYYPLYSGSEERQ